jgi:hypothetical protein
MPGAWTDKIMKHGGGGIYFNENKRKLSNLKLDDLGVEKTFWRLRYEQKVTNFH